MQVIEGGHPDETENPSIGELPRWRVIWDRIVCEVWYWRLRRWLPRLVWLNDEIDVCVTFPEDKINLDDPMGAFMSGGIHELQGHLHRMGITFDSGCGSEGRDWQWDFSLSGPISVKFRGRAKHPEKRVRKESPRPRLVG